MANGDTQVAVTSEGVYHLGLAIDLCLNYHTGPQGRKAATVSHWREDEGVLYFGWHASMDGTALPAEMDRDMLIPLIMAWLKKADYGEEPDIDGSVYKGWRIWNQIKYEVKGWAYISFAIAPEFVEYHK